MVRLITCGYPDLQYKNMCEHKSMTHSLLGQWQEMTTGISTVQHDECSNGERKPTRTTTTREASAASSEMMAAVQAT